MSKPRHADKDSAPTSSGSKQIHHLSNYIFLFLLAVFLIAVYTFLLQKSYSTSTLEANVDQNITCSDAIHKLVSNTFTRDDFTDINTVDDMSSERYQTLQTTLNQIRSLNSTRYLYTAKSNSEGKLIYLVDGLDLDTSDFAYPGTYIKDEMIPYINSTLSGKTIYSQETIDTTWGHIFTACYPVKATDGSNEIIGALCIEMDMESAYTFLSKSSRNSLQIAIAAAIIALLLLVTLPVWNVNQSTSREDGKSVGLTGALKIKGVPFLLLGFFAYCAAEATTMQWASTYFVEAKGIAADRAAGFAALFYIGITAGRFISGIITDRLGDRKMILLGTGILVCGIFILCLPVKSYTVAFAAFLVIGLGCAPIYPCIIHSTPYNFGAENSGAIIGIQMASAYVGSTFIPPLFGLLGNAVSFSILPVYLLGFVVLMITMVETTFRITRKEKVVKI